ncbi:MAG: hypothetical protein ACKVQB_06950 [Bacteroidia bacterium]
MNKIKGSKILIAFLFIFLIAGCKRDLETTWDAEYATPVAHAEMDLADLVGDSLLVKKGDNSLDLVYDYQLAVDSIDRYLEVPDTLQEKSVTLGKIVLDNRKLSDTITLGEIYPLSKLLDGQTQTLPAFDQDGSNNKQEIDVTKQFFKQAKFKEGFIDMTLKNELPVEAEKIVFQLLNKSDGAIIIYDSFLNVMPNDSVKTTKSLAGKKIDGVLVGIVKRVKTKASKGPVLINSQKGIILDLAIRDLELEFATAVFPSQNLVEENQEVQYNLGQALITYMELNSGYVVMEVFSNVKEEIILDYSIPNSMRNFNKSEYVRQTVKVPPAKEGSFSKVTKKFPLDGYQIFYRGKNPDLPPFKYNTIYSEFTARIEYTGIERTLSLSDSVYVRFGLVEIKPKLAIGDFGIHLFNFDEKQSVKFFENVKGNISLEDVKMGLVFKNTFGIQADISIDNITGVNTRTGNSVKLISSAMPPTFLVDRAKNDPFVPYYYNIFFDKNNSNLKQFLENIPDRLDSKFSMEVRKRGSQDYTDFVFDTSQLTAHLRLEIPVQFGTDGLELSQLQAFNFMNFKNADRIKSGVLKLDVTNGYPFEATCDIEFLDEQNLLLTTLFEVGKAQTVLPGNIDGNGMVSSPAQSQLFAEIPATKMQIIKNAKKIRIKTKFSTPDGNRYKIYSTYKFGVKLKGNFVYEQSF